MRRLKKYLLDRVSRGGCFGKSLLGFAANVEITREIGTFLMSGFYFLISVFASLPKVSAVWGTFSQPIHANVVISESSETSNSGSSKACGLRVGAPVLLKGEIAGKVVAVNSPSSALSANDVPAAHVVPVANKNPGALTIEIEISPNQRWALRSGLVAVLTTPVVKAKTDVKTIVELLPPKSDAKPLKSNESVPGFSSLQALWNAA